MTPQQDNIESAWMYWYPKVYAYFYKRVNDRFFVEELTAQTMNTAFTAQNVRIFHAYMWKVAHNYLVKYINTKQVQPMPVSLEDYMLGDDTKANQFMLDESADNIVSSNYNSKLDQLKICIKNNISSPDDQNLIELCIYQEKNSTEVGNLLNINPPAIRKRLSRILSKLRTHCRELWPEKLALAPEIVNKVHSSIYETK